MALVDLNLRPDQRQLNQFGWMAFVVFGVLGTIALFKNELFGIHLGVESVTIGISLWGVGLVSALFSLVAPRGNQLLFTVLTLLAFPIGLVVSHVVLAFLFFAILTPLALFFRLIGRDALERRINKEAASYWISLPPQKDKAAYFRQF